MTMMKDLRSITQYHNNIDLLILRHILSSLLSRKKLVIKSVICDYLELLNNTLTSTY